MSKIKRNDPCPCGSGKKYKNCCGFENAANTSVERTNSELQKLHQQFAAAIMDGYAQTLANLKARYHRDDMDNDAETAEIYQTGLTLWILFHIPFGTEIRTIFSDFFNKSIRGVSRRTRELFASWGEQLPSAYEVVQVDANSHQLTLDDCRTRERFRIPYHPEEDFSEGSLLIGTLVPYADQYGFFYTIIKLYRHEPEHITQLLNTYDRQDGGLQEHFPDFLADALNQGKETDDWSNAVHENVAQLFADHMIEKNVQDDVLFKGVAFWQRYAQEAKPSLRKPEPYAAALEYLVQKDWLQDTTITQDQLAREYNCTPGSISANYRKLAAESDES
ncbi:helix-turn-helix domain-containing protein [Barrientosiimonas marina]|uniref:SEC-C metal-binding domain-containing protein n=1 Tax=Lentibacillus kimchii TaxID=1542911 RepID=A0ABW2UY20_9BACI